MSHTPVSLLERLRTRPDDATWTRLVRLYTPYIERWLAQGNVPASDAADLTQEVVLTLVREVGQFDHSGRPGAFRRWLRTLVVHRTLAYWRSRRTRGSAVDQKLAADLLDRLQDPRNDLAERWDADHDAFVMQRLLELIEPDFTATTWLAFRRQAVDGRTAAEAATELGISSNAALIAKSRVLRRLRREAEGLVD
jgi:RNA polymerase sigma-70 factor (ECF subfamily)